MNIIGKGIHATAVQWPGFTEDDWSRDTALQAVIDFLAPITQQNIVPAIIKALWVGGADGHYNTELKTPNGFAPLPDGAYIVKLNQGGALYAVDPDTFAKQWKVVA